MDERIRELICSRDEAPDRDRLDEEMRELSRANNKAIFWALLSCLFAILALAFGRAEAQFDPTPEIPLYEVDEGGIVYVPLNRENSDLTASFDVALVSNDPRVVVPELVTFAVGEATILIPVSAPENATVDNVWPIRVIVTPPSGMWMAMDIQIIENDTDTTATLSFGPSL